MGRNLCALVLIASMSSAAAAAEIVFAQRPGVLLNAAELAGLRAQIGKPGWKSDFYLGERTLASTRSGQGIRTNAEKWLNRSIEIPARGGHYHHFFCDDGDMLEYPADQNFAPGPYRCPKCGREYEGEKYEAAVRRLVHYALADAAWDLALVSALEQRPECAAQAARILLEYARAYPGPHTSSTKGGMIYQSLDESMWIIPLAQAYDLIYPQLDAEERSRIEGFLRTVAGGIQACGVGGNWGSWHLSAVGVIGFAIQDRELVDWAIRAFDKQIRDDLGDDGLWPESVHTYHYFPLHGFISLAEAARHAGLDLYRREVKPGKTLMSMFTAPLAYAYPDLRLAAINDGWFKAFVPTDFYELAYAREERPEFAWVIANGRGSRTTAGKSAEQDPTQRGGRYAFLFGHQDVPPQTEPYSPASINFPVLGICVLRSPRGSMMTFDYGPFLGHGQFDKMGVTLFAHNRLWMADYGTPGYGSSIMPWYKSTWSHNTVVVDGGNQATTKENKVLLWLGDDHIEAAQSLTTQAYPGVSHTRTVMRTPDYFVVLDQLDSNEKHTYDLRWHAEGQLALDESSAPASTSTSAPAPALPAQLTEAVAAPPRSSLQARWSDGEAGIMITVLADAPFQPISARCPAETASRSIPLLICRGKGSAASFTTVLLPFRDQVRPPAVHRDAQHLLITTIDSIDRITLPSDGRGPVLSRMPTGGQ